MVASPFASVSSRNLSWTPWKRTPEAVVSDPSTVPEVAAAVPESTSAALATDIPSIAAATEGASASASIASTPTAQAAELLPQSPATADVPALEELITKGTEMGKPLADVLNSPEAVHAAMKVSDLGLVGLDHGALSIFGWTRDALVGMHMVTGLPWYVQVALSPEHSKLIRQVGNNRRVDHFNSTVSLPLSRPNDKTQHPIPSRQSSIHRPHETSE
jgi:YidC/Oxa1 family membrane protein insertase